MIRVDSRVEKNGKVEDGFEGGLNLLIREETVEGYIDRPRHRPGVIGWITDATGERLYYPQGGNHEGEAIPASRSVLAEIVSILAMSIEELKARAKEDSKYF